MINELSILAAVAHDRGSFDAVVEHLDPEELSAHGHIVWKAIQKWYDRDTMARAVDVVALRDRILKSHPAHKVAFGKLLREMTPQAGTKNITRDVLELKREAAGSRLATALSSSASPDTIAALIHSYLGVNDAAGLLDAGGATVFATPLSQLITRTEDKGERTKLLPIALNNHLRGGLLPGHCVVVMGRVNVGKSAFAINAAVGFIKQGKRVLYVENEDLVEDTALRVGCRLVGCNRDWAGANAEDFERRALDKGYARLILPDPAPAGVADIDRLLMQFSPDVCIVNQARNLVRENSQNTVAELDHIAKSLRSMGKRRRIIMVLITAAKEGAEEYGGKIREKPVLEMADCYSSKTGFPAAADVMVGFGSSTALEEQDMACLSLCKNKLGGDKAVIYVTVDFDRGLIREAT